MIIQRFSELKERVHKVTRKQVFDSKQVNCHS